MNKKFWTSCCLVAALLCGAQAFADVIDHMPCSVQNWWLGEDANERLLEASCNNDFARVRQAIACGADVNYHGYGNTPLGWAALYGDLQLIQLLLEHGANANEAIRDNGWTPLHEAVLWRRTKVVELLLEHGANTNVATRDMGQTPLYTAVHLGYTDVAELLIKMGAEVNAMNKFGWTPLDHIYSNEVIIGLLKQHGAKTGEELRAEAAAEAAKQQVEL